MKKSSLHDINLLVNDLYKAYGKDSYKSIVKTILNSASKNIKKNEIEKDLDKFKYRKISYNENIFTEPIKLLKLLEDNIDIIENINRFKSFDYNNDKLIFVSINTLIQTAKLMFKEEKNIKYINVYNFIYNLEL